MAKTLAQLVLGQLVPMDQIYPDPVKLRAVDPDHVEEIRLSLETKGQQQPIRIRPTEAGYLVVFGEHRLLAGRELSMAGKPIKHYPVGMIMCIVEKISEYESLELKFTENAHRNSFVDPWEEGKVLRKLLDEKYHGDLDALARSLSKTNQYIKDRTRVYDCLDLTLRKYIGIRGGLSNQNIITLAKYDDRAVQVALGERIVASNKINVKSPSWGRGGGGGGGPDPWRNAPKGKIEYECTCNKCGNLHKRPEFAVAVEMEVPDVSEAL
jgi:ParB/RepB/Spo0J family partition protein